MNDIQIVIITLFCSALFSGLEIAFTGLNRLQLELEMQNNVFSARIITLFLKNQSRFIGALLLGNNISNVIYGIAIARLLNPVVDFILPAGLNNEFMMVLCQSLISTLIVLLTAEFLPKILFRINPNAIMNVLALPAMLIYIVLFPLIIIYIGLSELIIRYILGVKADNEDYKLSTIDLNDYLKEYADPKNLDNNLQQEIELFQNAMEFHTAKLRECMVPRNEILAMRHDADLEEVRQMFINSKHSKLLVYQDNSDNIIGYVHINDFLKNPTTLEPMIRHIDFYPESYPAHLLLKKLMKKQQSVAVVVDEYGGTAGMVTTEDLIEEIFGEIEDEFDDERNNAEENKKEDEYVLSARLDIDYLKKTYDFDFEESDDYNTLAGYILHNIGYIPKTNEELQISRYLIKVLEATPSKIEKVQIKKIL